MVKVKAKPFIPKLPVYSAAVPILHVPIEQRNGSIVGEVRSMGRDGLMSDEPPLPPKPNPFVAPPPLQPTPDDPAWLEKPTAKRDAAVACIEMVMKARVESCRVEGRVGGGVREPSSNELRPLTREGETLWLFRGCPALVSGPPRNECRLWLDTAARANDSAFRGEDLVVNQESPIPHVLLFLGDHHFGLLSKTFRNYLSQLQAVKFRTCTTASAAAASADPVGATDLPRPNVQPPQAWPDWLNTLVVGWDATFGKDGDRATAEERNFKRFQTGGQITIADPNLLRRFEGMKFGSIAASMGRNSARG